MKDVVSLEIAKKLCEAGFPQHDTYFTHRGFTRLAAPMLSEILEKLPESALVFRPLTVNIWRDGPVVPHKWQASIAGNEEYCCVDENFIDTQFSFTQFADNPADAAGLLWLAWEESKKK